MRVTVLVLMFFLLVTVSFSKWSSQESNDNRVAMLGDSVCNGTILTPDTSKAGMEQPVVYWVPSIAPAA